MEKIIKSLEELEKINNSYDLYIESIENLKRDITDVKVCTPVIGKFSSGKSALVNTILGYSRKILKEDITPETSIPTEITYTDKEDIVTLFGKDGKKQCISVDEYRSYGIDSNNIKLARIQLRNSFLKEIPDVMLVDMPGFESGFENHNKAIDGYLAQSLAYIVVFPADDMIVRSSIGSILKELCLHDIPLCVVITKHDKRNDDFDETFLKMQENIKRFIGDREVRYCMTSSFTGDAEELEGFLKEIQSKSQDILARNFTKSVLIIIDNIENNLKTILNTSQLSESELNDKEEKLHKQLLHLDNRLLEEQKNFNSDISNCIEEIKNDIKCAMERQESTLAIIIMNNQNINEYLNNTIRNTVIISVKNRFIPRVEKYLKYIDNYINEESIGDIHININFDIEGLSMSTVSNALVIIAGIFMGFPILGVIISELIKFQSYKKREEKMQRIRMNLRNQVFPQALEEVGNGIESAITNQVELINNSIEDEVKKQRYVLEKTLGEVRTQIYDEKAEKENLAVNINADLEKIREIRYVLQ